MCIRVSDNEGQRICSCNRVRDVNTMKMKILLLFRYGNAWR